MTLTHKGEGEKQITVSKVETNIHFMFQTLKNENVTHLNIDLFLHGTRPSASEIQLESGGQ